MNDIYNTLGVVATIVTFASFFFGVWQWRERIKVEEIWMSEVKSIWDIATSYSIDSSKVNSFFKTDINASNIAYRLSKINTALNIIIRDISPMYVRLLGKKLNYKVLRCMIVANEIRTVYTMKILLQNFPLKERDENEEAKLYDLLTKSVERTQNTISTIKEIKFNASKKRDGLYGS
jgi:hypothetical protein